MNMNHIVTSAATPAVNGYMKKDRECRDEIAVQESKVTQTPNVDTYVSQEKSTEELETYSPNVTLVEQLKAEQTDVQTRFLRSVQEILAKQGKEVAIGEGIWKMLASGDYEVDAETQAAAKQAISEDGYWGVKQTSQRIVSFAKALVGGNPSQIETMREAFIKGFEAATGVWGGELPSITGQTYDAVMELFDQWAEEETAENM